MKSMIKVNLPGKLMKILSLLENELDRTIRHSEKIYIVKHCIHISNHSSKQFLAIIIINKQLKQQINQIIKPT